MGFRKLANRRNEGQVRCAYPSLHKQLYNLFILIVVLCAVVEFI